MGLKAMTHSGMSLHHDENCVRCAIFDVSMLKDAKLMQEAAAALPWPERKEKAQRYKFDADRRLCVGAGLLAAHMLREAGVRNLSMGYGVHEKPFLIHEADIHFNLSHSGCYAVCAVASVPVGVDVEVVCDHGRAVARRCFRPHELAWLDGQSDRSVAFTRLWVRKESYIKLTGTGLSRDPLTFCVLPGQAAEVEASFEEFSVGDVMGCVCTQDAMSVRFESWSMA